MKADEVFFDLQILTSAPLGDFVTSFARTSGAATTAAAGRGTHWREEERAALLTVSPLHSGPTGQQHFRASLPCRTERSKDQEKSVSMVFLFVCFFLSIFTVTQLLVLLKGKYE